MPQGMCEKTGKIIYRTRRDARIALDKLRARRAETPERHAYNCPHCGKWHVTRMGEKPSRKPRETRMEPARRWRWKGNTTEE